MQPCTRLPFLLPRWASVARWCVSRAWTRAIRSLAENSSKTANDIQDISNLVTGAVNRLADNAQKMLDYIGTDVMKDYDTFVGIVNQYEADADLMSQILSEFVEQASTINDTMRDMNTGIVDVTTTVGESARAISSVVKIPVIASGGAGTLEHFHEALTVGGAEAALAASLFHYKELEIRQVKEYLRDKGVSVRL